MTNVTEVLENESGIQYQGVNDASGGTGAYPTIGLIVGNFRRGRTDKPMTINNSNIRALLGFDPENKDYVTVQDTLNTGVPSVQVVRVVDTTTARVCIEDYWNVNQPSRPSYYYTIRADFGSYEPDETELNDRLLAIQNSLTVKIGENTFPFMKQFPDVPSEEYFVAIFDSQSKKLDITLFTYQEAETILFCADFPFTIQTIPQ